MSNVALLWDNFGPSHVDECSALADALAGERKVVGIELFAKSGTYGWGRWQGTNFEQVTVYEQTEQARQPGTLATAWRIVRICQKQKVKYAFFCHYEKPYVFLAALILRLLGRRLFVLSDSKFDDYRRYLRRELGKSIFMKPYHGGIAASRRCADYIRFLGVNPKRIRTGYYGIALQRIREAAGAPPAPAGTPFEQRDFLSIARLVPKKNHRVMLEAFALYVRASQRPRRLVLCGSGPLEAEIREQIDRLGIASFVDVLGNVLPADVAPKLGKALCLLLPSVEEQFGIVVVEAQAMGLPVIVSTAVGARDNQVRTWVNGFVVEPDNAEGMARAMQLLSSDRELWSQFSRAAAQWGPRQDVSAFVASAVSLIRDEPVEPTTVFPQIAAAG